MNERVLTPINEMGDFASQASLVHKWTEGPGHLVTVAKATLGIFDVEVDVRVRAYRQQHITRIELIA